MDWPREKCLQMVKIYQSLRCLWDPSHKNYKDIIHKQDAWQKIANQLKCSVEEAKKKMDSLLASYRRERQKSMKSKLGSGAKSRYVSRWFAYNSMLFLLDKYKPRRSYITSKNQNTVKTNEHENGKNEQADMDLDGTHTKLTRQLQPSTTPSKIPKYTASSEYQLTPRRSKTEDPGLSKSSDCLKHTYKSNYKDRNQTFGDYIASKHCEYSRHTQAIVEHYISDILFEADMGKYESSLMSTPMSPYASDCSQHSDFNSVNIDPADHVTTVFENSLQTSSNCIKLENPPSPVSIEKIYQPLYSPDSQIEDNSLN